jgi:predicted transcriptional regulator
MILEAMNTIELKSDLHRLIDKVNDISLLKAIKIILAKETTKETDWADTLSEDLRHELEESIAEADQGKTISHEDAMKQIKSRYNL